MPPMTQHRLSAGDRERVTGGSSQRDTCQVMVEDTAKAPGQDQFRCEFLRRAGEAVEGRGGNCADSVTGMCG